MNLLYCTKCQQIVDKYFRNKDSDLFFCEKCKGGIHYFGQEEAILSSQDIFDLYDTEHPFNPVADFKGTQPYISFPSSVPDLDLLSCKDVLEFDPLNYEALYHLGNLYLSRQQLELSKDTFLLLSKHYPDSADVYKKLVQINVKTKDYDNVIDYLNALHKLQPNSFYILEYLALIYLKMEHYQQSLRYFIKAYKLAGKHSYQDNLKKNIRKLMSFIKKKN
ncbi:hypothetical protein DID75_05375 [Candidatus Marinamargulisbacteria bacterium SCGC AG-410-N11]|nr:hypothetical protein DID75_05375 [Candidatus Marinamargulisbacteria bacterium SCGC AG-410-N11]